MYSERSLQVLAMARLCGVEGSDKEILEKYENLYVQIKQLQDPPEPAKVTVFKRPF